MKECNFHDGSTLFFFFVLISYICDIPHVPNLFKSPVLYRWMSQARCLSRHKPARRQHLPDGNSRKARNGVWTFFLLFWSGELASYHDLIKSTHEKKKNIKFLKRVVIIPTACNLHGGIQFRHDLSKTCWACLGIVGDHHRWLPLNKT